MQQAEIEMFQKLPPDLHYFFAEILRLARAYTSLDDLEHYQTTRLTLPLRRGLRELGGRLVKRGLLSEPMDIFFAHRQQIDEAIHEDSDAGWDKFTEESAIKKRVISASQGPKTRMGLWTRQDSGTPSPAIAFPGWRAVPAKPKDRSLWFWVRTILPSFPKAPYWWRERPIPRGRLCFTARWPS